eukprot:762067_1
MGNQPDTCCSCDKRMTDKPIEQKIGHSRQKQNNNINNKPFETSIETTEQQSIASQSYTHTDIQGEGMIMSIVNTGDTQQLFNHQIYNANSIKPHWMAQYTQSKFYLKLSKFIKVLPTKSRQHIWEHSVTIKRNGGKKTVLNETRDSKQITRLLSDAVIVYCKYLDRDKPKLQRKEVDPHLQQITMYIYNKFKPLQRDRFENEKDYFSYMIQDFIQHNHTNDAYA